MQTKTKICFVVPKVYPYFDESKGSSGGAERQTYYLGKELSKIYGYEISYAVADYGNANRGR